MLRLWPDPRDSETESLLWLWSILVSLAVIATATIWTRIVS